MGFKFQNFDFLHLDSSFSEDELLVRRTARDFVRDNIVPIVEDCFREGRFPANWFRSNRRCFPARSGFCAGAAFSA